MKSIVPNWIKSPIRSPEIYLRFSPVSGEEKSRRNGMLSTAAAVIHGTTEIMKHAECGVIGMLNYRNYCIKGAMLTTVTLGDSLNMTACSLEVGWP